MAAKLLTEFIGTFFLVLTIGLTVLGGSTFAPLAIGAVLMVMVYMGGPISGGHFNPAVTLGVWMRGEKMARSEVGPYMAAQTVGAFAAGIVVYVILGGVLMVTPAAETSLFGFFLLELLFTFALVLVVLNTATADATAGNSYYGLAIGFTVLVGAFAAGPISGGAFNPAVALGPILVDAIFGSGASLAGLWVYLAATFAGGALAAVVFKVQHAPVVRAPVPAVATPPRPQL
jgi:aquaporin Z